MALSPLLAERPALVAGSRHAYWRWPGGRVEEVSHSEALKRARTAAPLVCHGPATARRLKVDALAAYDLLELFAFVHPARFVVPSAVGLAQLFGLKEPQGLLEAAALLPELAELLLADLDGDRQTKALAWTLAKAGWSWGPAVLAAIGLDQSSPPASGGLNIWDRLPQWQDEGPLPPPTQEAVSDSEARQRLAQLLSADAEARPQQADFASALTLAFQPRLAPGNPRMILAEAGTGVGKTLGYIAPASLWAEKNKGTVYLSTFTRNLQQQLDRELDRLYPDPQEKAAKVVIRKGRENYLCLLNFEEAVHGLVTRPGDTVAVALMARWASASRDGDMVGGDFPGWLPEVIGQARTLGLTDRRGECIYSACPHYSRCFIERSIRKAKRARLVVANHALVLSQAVLGAEEGSEPQRLVFDEGHHLFGAADEAFAAELSGLETVELRRWLLGGEGGRSATRLRGLKRRLDELASGDEKALEALDRALMAARALPGEGWTKRLEMGEPQGPTERFLGQVRLQVLARNNARDAGEEGYDLEADAKPANEELLVAAQRLGEALADLMEPLAALRQRLLDKLEDESEELESDQRRRLDGLVRSLERRAILPLSAWRQMLVDLAGQTPKTFIDWLAISRIDARARDVGYLRHYVDPLQPFAERVLKAAHGVVVTSATLTDSSGDLESDWKAAEERTGARHLEMGAERARVPSPFDYAKQTKVLIVGDVARDRPGEVAAAYQALFQAAGGGGLGLFTSIARLKAVQQKIAGPLEEAGLQLYAQHVDRMDTATLVELFRAEEHSCLLGTDAVRDGVDVPGRALRLIVFEKVPWPRPDIRHRARREHFGKRGYDDLLTRLKLRQAFGRLIRRADDQGVFVLLEAAFPSRLATAFPPGVAIERIGLKAAIEATRAFLNPGRRQD